jgi:hypothetical protein
LTSHPRPFTIERVSPLIVPLAESFGSSLLIIGIVILLFIVFLIGAAGGS